MLLSDTFGRYKICKLRGTFPIVILIEQASRLSTSSCVKGLANQKKIQSLPKLTTHFCPFLADQVHETLEHHPRYGNSTEWLNGRSVQIQDGFKSKVMLGPIKGACSLLEAALAMDCVYGSQSIYRVKITLPDKMAITPFTTFKILIIKRGGV